MLINPNSFILARPPGIIFWDFEKHKQFELTGNHLNRFFDLIENIHRYDDKNTIDQEFLENGILVHRITPTPWGWDELSRLFHYGTRDLPFSKTPNDEKEWAELYLQHCSEVLATPPPLENYHHCQGPSLSLPAPAANSALSEILHHRSTSRVFEQKQVALNDVSEMLYHTLGFIGERALPEASGLPESLRNRRCSPSGGGLNATEGYVYIQHVEGLAAGFYYYNPLGHTLHLCSEGTVALGALLSGQHFANDLAFGVFLTSRFDKLWWKYEHSRAYRMAFVEIGHLSQTFQLLATHIGLKSWITGALNETKIEPLLKLKAPAEHVLFFVGAGHGTGKAVSRELEKLL